MNGIKKRCRECESDYVLGLSEGMFGIELLAAAFSNTFNCYAFKVEAHVLSAFSCIVSIGNCLEFLVLI